MEGGGRSNGGIWDLNGREGRTMGRYGRGGKRRDSGEDGTRKEMKKRTKAKG